MYLYVLIFTVATLKMLHCIPYGHQSFVNENYPLSSVDSPGFHPSRTTNRPGFGFHKNEFQNLDHFPHIGPTIHGPQIDINSQPFAPIDDIPPFGFGNGPFDDRPSRENSFPRPQQPRRSFNGRPDGFNPSRDDTDIGISQLDTTFNERPSFIERPSRQNPQQRPFNGGSLGRPQFDDRPSRQNPPVRPQPGRPFNGRPSVNLDPSRQDFSGRPEFDDRPSIQNPPVRPQPGRPFNGRPSVNLDPSRQDSSGRPEFDERPSRQNPPVRPQPGRPFNGRPSVNLDPSRQESSGTPISLIPSGENDREEVFIFDKPTSKRPPTTASTTTTTTTAKSCDCPTTPEFNPVCGTNEQTYTNPGKLKCAVLCGTDVRLHYYGSCITTTESASTTVATSP